MALAPNQLKVLGVSSSNNLLFAFDSSAGVHCIFAIRCLVFDESEEQPEESNSASAVSTTPAKLLPPDSFATIADSHPFHYTIGMSRSAFDAVDRSRALTAVGPVESSPSLLRLALSNASFVGAHAVPSGDRFERCLFPSPLHADEASVASSVSHATTNSQAPSETPAGCVRSIPQNSTPSSASAIKSALKSSASRTTSTSTSQASHSRTESSKNVSFGEHLKYLCERSATSRPAPLLEKQLEQNLGSTPNEEAHLSKQFSEAPCERTLDPPMVIPVKSFLFQCACVFCYTSLFTVSNKLSANLWCLAQAIQSARLVIHVRAPPDVLSAESPTLCICPTLVR